MGRRKQWGNDSTRTIDLKSGGSVTLTFHGNFFDLTPEEQRLIADLTEIVHKYNAAPEPNLLTNTQPAF